MKKHLAIIFLLTLCACTEMRVKRYSNLLDPMLGQSKKEDINKLLGNPHSCQQEGVFEKCEYRTSTGRNDPVPAVHRKEVAMGPDLSPYDAFDVLQVQYDGMGIFKDWQPVVISNLPQNY